MVFGAMMNGQRIAKNYMQNMHTWQNSLARMFSAGWGKDFQSCSIPLPL